MGNIGGMGSTGEGSAGGGSTGEWSTLEEGPAAGARRQQDFGRGSVGKNTWEVQGIEGSAGGKGSTGKWH